MLQLMGDFETTTDPQDCRVWASCLVNIDTLKVDLLANNIDDFFNYVKNKNSVVYFHNLKFDGEFIIHYLLSKLHYKHNDSKQPRTFQTLITDDGQFYSITIYFVRRNKQYLKCVIYDSYKKLPFKVSVIAETFKLPIAKGHIDYTARRDPGHKLTLSESKYIIKDCRIVATALKQQFAEGLKKMTIGSDALNGFKKVIKKSNFEKWFPVLPIEIDDDIRRSYKGGFTWLNPKYKNKRLAGCAYDVNSLYPSVMYLEPMPYGYPVPYDGEYIPDPEYPLYIQRIRCEFKVKPDHIPSIQLKNNNAFIATEYLTSSKGEITELTLTSVDLALFLDHYEVWNLEYEAGYKFKSAVGIFKDYIDYWNDIKENSTGGRRQLAKLMNNNLYGKFATNPKGAKKRPYLEENTVKYSTGEEEVRNPVYTAVGSFITSYARDKTIRTAQTCYDRFIYADTDSIHLVGYDPPEIDIHETHLGSWKFEGKFNASKFVRAKTYMENYFLLPEEWAKLKPDGQKKWTFNPDSGVYEHLEIKCAGMPDDVKKQVTWDNFQAGSTFSGKLYPKRVSGGIVLEPGDFQIRNK